ncbi:acyl-CoA desaturase [Paucibacter sp. O1-1]|uniref:fatty acid desaturase family protein n=1 Tax=Paucibacter sp. XJ19-41 TaxID=2927824 RepID=UPI0010F8882D|nr:acyl-CoA desaturase [Paucibacter sp. XJ19-41]MCU7371439.1 acyl-CoA desaturase [Paucibacter sp. O1-1]MDA3826428.1 acyl-CoA desaturase [Paucibacter sp. O1-1]MDC6167243.1 acyl-CoA desaturase [Paucibacter sp. XJ19-41]
MSKSLTRNLANDELEKFGAEIEALRAKTVADLGERDARYIRNIFKAVRWTEFAGRALLMIGAFLPTPWLIGFWVLGTLSLALSKIMDNMELGHNVIHGQYDWMGDPHLKGKQFEWDIIGTSDNWRKTHNFRHHTYTNIHGLDDDIGYGVLRLFPEQRWTPAALFQPLYALVFAALFQWGVAIQDLRLGQLFGKRKKAARAELRRAGVPVLKKMSRQLIKDYLIFPLLAGPGFLVVASGNLVANGLRNIWTYTIIFCGHFTTDVETFPKGVLKNETRAHWYWRQIRGSSNLAGGFVLNTLSGNLSHQIEHHLFPDVPANRYVEMAPVVRDICKRYGVHYNTGSLPVQFGQVIWRILRHALPSRPRASRLASANS